MARRFYSDSPIETDELTLDGSEAHHLLHVLRATAGDRVVLFDGRGAEFEAEVTRTARKQVELHIIRRVEISRELSFEITLAVALPRGDRQEWLVQKAVEVGVTRLVPLQTSRSVAKPNEKSLARLRRGVIEASKQCGRNRLMEIEAPTTWNSFLEKTPLGEGQSTSHDVGLIAHLSGGQFFNASENAVDRYFVAIGPEGGFDDDEVNAAVEQGWRLWDLGASTLRTETAAIVAAGHLRLRN